MTNYLAIVNRYEFAQFYRFGYIIISAPELLVFNEIESNETKSNLVSHFQNKTPFEYDEEYLIIHLSQEMENLNLIQKFFITDLKSIYPLSKQAKLSIQDRIDSRIKLEEPIFENLIPDIISDIQRNEIEMSISALWKIFELDGPSESIQHKIGVDNISKGIISRKEGVKSFQMQKMNIWSILIAYDRYEYFPNSTLGYFFDSGLIFAYSKQSNFENSKLYSLLKSINVDSKTPMIFSELENSENSKLYIANSYFNDLKFHIVAPLYLMLKAEFKKHDDLTQSKYLTKTSLEYFKSFGDEFKAAIILLGSFFGFKKVYDFYYDKLNLPFFKTYKTIEDIEKNLQNDIIEVQEEVLVQISETEMNKEVITNVSLEIEEINYKVPNESNEVVESINTEGSKEESQETSIETIKENPLNENLITEKSTSMLKEFNFKTFTLDMLNQKKQISLSDLADQIKIARGDKKKMTNSELEKEVSNLETLEVTHTKTKMVILKTVLDKPN
jgi:hypothetical protein